MGRPRLCRRIAFAPDVVYFKPAGTPLKELEESVISFEEYEAIRLKDLEGLEQEEAAAKMDISQPTFHRLILAARKKIADAVVNGKVLRIEGGTYRITGRRRMRRRGL
ncbi:MAG: DUF134 domain-containing protein [Nanoarchaeota archaeon]